MLSQTSPLVARPVWFGWAGGTVLRGSDSCGTDGFLPIESRELARLFRTHSPLVYSRALRILGSDAEADEVTQDAFVRLLTTSASPPEPSRMVPWLCTLTTNLCLNRLRDRTRHEAAHSTGLGHTPEAELPRQAALSQMRRLLARADEREARAAVYVLVDGMTHEEAASYMEVSPRTVGNLVDRFRTWARDELDERAAGRGAA